MTPRPLSAPGGSRGTLPSAGLDAWRPPPESRRDPCLAKEETPFHLRSISAWGRRGGRGGGRGHKLLPILDFLFINSRFVLQPVTTALALYVLVRSPHLLAPYLATLGLGAAASMVYYVRAERDSDCCYWILYSWFSLLALTWLPLAAALTLRSRSWMTR